MRVEAEPQEGYHRLVPPDEGREPQFGNQTLRLNRLNFFIITTAV